MVCQSFVIAVAICLFLAASESSATLPVLITTLSCEGKLLSISCPPGSVIRIVSGMYGRFSIPHANPWFCPRGINNGVNTCISDRAQGIIEKECNDRQSCSFYGSNSVFGDPCPGASKYTRVMHRCYEKKVQTKHACEHETLSITCPAGSVIQVVKGFYGRTSDEYCARGPRSAYSCSSSRAQGIIASKCNNKQSCSVESSNSVFGDPCVGTFKYTAVEYYCYPEA